jgi:TRAP-type mannitol/chloroaromatic compound transport system permease small subunit
LRFRKLRGVQLLGRILLHIQQATIDLLSLCLCLLSCYLCLLLMYVSSEILVLSVSVVEVCSTKVLKTCLRGADTE